MEIDNAIVVRNIENYCKNEKISRARLEQSAGISNGLFMHWAKNDFGVGSTSIKKLSYYTKIPVYVWFKEGGIEWAEETSETT